MTEVFVLGFYGYLASVFIAALCIALAFMVLNLGGW